MKHLLLLFAAALLLTPAGAQVWLELGGKTMIGLTGYRNANIDTDALHDGSLNAAVSYGGVVGLNFGDYHGLNLEGMYGKHQQRVTFRGTGVPVTNNVKWDAWDFYALYRFYARQGTIIELGPKLTRVQSVEQVIGSVRSNPEGQYNDQFYSGVFGIGSFLGGSPYFTLKMGLRFEYAFTDFVSEAGKASNFPASYTSYETYKPTTPFRAGVYLELNFGVGGIAQSTCGRRGFLFGSQYQ